MSGTERRRVMQLHHDYFVREAREGRLTNVPQYVMAMERERNGEVDALPRTAAGVSIADSEQAEQILTTWCAENHGNLYPGYHHAELIKGGYWRVRFTNPEITLEVNAKDSTDIRKGDE